MNLLQSLLVYDMLTKRRPPKPPRVKPGPATPAEVEQFKRDAAWADAHRDGA